MEPKVNCRLLLSQLLFFVYLSVVTASNADSATSSVLQSGISPTCPAGTTTQKVSFVHVGDLHANFDLVKDKYSRIRAYMEKVRQENPYTVFTNAGDDHEKGSVAEQYSRGIAVKEVTFAMQFDVRTIGNHDFAWGTEHLLAFSRDPYSLVLSSNTHYDGPDSEGLGSVDYGVLQVGCLKIGFLGLVGPSWNSLDQEAEIDYLPSLHTTFNYAEVAKNIVDSHRSEVDLMVMVSHLGNYLDIAEIAKKVAGIDLILGGHSHLTPTQSTINNTLVVLPNFYGDGVTRIDINVNVAATTKSVTSKSTLEKTLAELTDVNASTHKAISDILTIYAPDAQQTLSYLENLQDYNGMAAIAAKAAIAQHNADAALLHPLSANQYLKWSAGAVSLQDINNGYFVERQPSNTPGINAFYMVEVSGANLKLMKGQQTTWVYSGPVTPVDATTYKVIIHKDDALNPSLVFPGVTFISVTYLTEAWETIAAYAESRKAACLWLDTNSTTQIPSCVHTALENGACGTASGSTFVSRPIGNLCSSGTAGTVSGTGPWTWGCNGINGGTSTSQNSCSANLKSWTVSATSGCGGTVLPASRTVSHGSTTTFAVTTDTGFTASVGGTCGGNLSGNTYTTNAIPGSCAVNIKSILKGDVNGDCVVNISDALLTLQYAMKLITHDAVTNTKYLAFADVAPLDTATMKPKGDGTIDIKDVLIILQRSVNLLNW